MIRLTRTIEYEYDSAEDMAKDVACWTLRPSTSKWFPFGPTKRARSTIVTVVDHGTPVDRVCVCGHAEDHHHDERSMVNNAFCDHFICSCQGFAPAGATT